MKRNRGEISDSFAAALFAVVCLIASGIALNAGFGYQRKEEWLANPTFAPHILPWYRTTGMVYEKRQVEIAVDPSERDRKPRNKPRYELLVNYLNQTQTSWLRIHKDEFPLVQIGDSIDVIHYPSRPEMSKITQRTEGSSRDAFVFSGVLLAASIAGGVFAWKRGRDC